MPTSETPRRWEKRESTGKSLDQMGKGNVRLLDDYSGKKKVTSLPVGGPIYLKKKKNVLFQSSRGGRKEAVPVKKVGGNIMWWWPHLREKTQPRRISKI